jgi:hypothetical protein
MKESVFDWLRGGAFEGFRCRFRSWLNKRDTNFRMKLRWRMFHPGLTWVKFKTGVAMGCSQF